MNDWQIEFNGLLMGDGTSYVVQSVTGLNDTPGVRSSDQDRPLRNGQMAGTDFATGRSIIASITVDGPHPNSLLWDAFSRAHVVAYGSESPLICQVPGFAEGRQVQILARCRRLSLPSNQDYAAGMGTAEVQWWATDPRIYDASLTTLSTAMASVSGTGRTYPRTYPLTFGGAVSGGLIQATNDGEFPSPWTATLTGPVTNPRVENVTTGAVVSFNGVLAAGQTLDLDSNFKSVLLNGTTSRYSWLLNGSRWFDIAPGLNQIRFAGSAGSGSMSLAFRSSWI